MVGRAGAIAAALTGLNGVAPLASAQPAVTLPAPSEVSAPPEGLVDRQPLQLRAPDAVVDAYLAAFSQRRWSVGGLSRREVLAEWAGLPLRPETKAHLADTSFWTIAEDGALSLEPPPSLVTAFSPAERAALYAWLAGSDANRVERWPLVIADAGALDAIAHRAKTSAALTARVRTLAYPFAGGLALSDVSVLAAEFPADELHRWLVAASAVQGFLPRLHLERARSVADALAYWTMQGRHVRIRPVLEALLRAPVAQGVELGPLLPGVGALWMNDIAPEQVRFDVTDVSFYVAATLNGIGSPPDDQESAETWFMQNFSRIAQPGQFGDVWVLDPGQTGPLAFACTWIADDIVLARDPVGLGLWRFVDWADMQRRNPHFAAGRWTCYRANPQRAAP